MISLFRGYIAVDLDGTLAYYDQWRGADHIGEPIPEMARRVERWLRDGTPVCIYTARVWSDGSPERDAEALVAHRAIQLYTLKLFGKALPATCLKDPGFVEFWDDRAVQVERNTGRRVDGK